MSNYPTDDRTPRYEISYRAARVTHSSHSVNLSLARSWSSCGAGWVPKILQLNTAIILVILTSV